MIVKYGTNAHSIAPYVAILEIRLLQNLNFLFDNRNVRKVRLNPV